MNRRISWALLLLMGLLSLAALACYSDNPLIPPTQTPTPTLTPVPLTAETEYQIGDSVTVVGNEFQIHQTQLPEADQRNNRVMGGACFPGTTTTVEDIGQDDAGNIYYKVTCVLNAGWLPAENIEAQQSSSSE